MFTSPPPLPASPFSFSFAINLILHILELNIHSPFLYILLDSENVTKLSHPLNFSPLFPTPYIHTIIISPVTHTEWFRITVTDAFSLSPMSTTGLVGVPETQQADGAFILSSMF